MGFISYLGGLESDLNGYADSKFILLSVSGFAHSLVLSEFNDSGYNSSLTGFIGSDGRTLTGALKTFKNFQKPPEVWDIQGCTINNLQLDAFHAILNIRNSTNNPITLTDVVEKYQYQAGINTNPNWYGSTSTNEIGYTVGFTSWNTHIDIDQGYKTFLGYNRHLLQFTAIQL